MSDDDQKMRAEIIESMQPMLAEARATGMVLQCVGYDPGIIYDADQLQLLMNCGTFCWGPPNWKLIERPKTKAERIKDLEAEVADLHSQIGFANQELELRLNRLQEEMTMRIALQVNVASLTRNLEAWKALALAFKPGQPIETGYIVDSQQIKAACDRLKDMKELP